MAQTKTTRSGIHLSGQAIVLIGIIIGAIAAFLIFSSFARNNAVDAYSGGSDKQNSFNYYKAQTRRAVYRGDSSAKDQRLERVLKFTSGGGALAFNLYDPVIRERIDLEDGDEVRACVWAKLSTPGQQLRASYPAQGKTTANHTYKGTGDTAEEYDNNYGKFCDNFTYKKAQNRSTLSYTYPNLLTRGFAPTDLYDIYINRFVLRKVDSQGPK